MTVIIFISMVCYLFVGVGFSVEHSFYKQRNLSNKRSKLANTLLALQAYLSCLYMMSFWPLFVLATVGSILYHFCEGNRHGCKG